MKAAVFRGKEFAVEEVPYPTLEPNGVIVKVAAAGICGSDLHFFQRGGPPGSRGVIMGHEFSGDVVDVGAEVKGVKKGDRVVAMSGKGCGECYWCQRGEFIKCARLGFIGYAIQGAFAEYVHVPDFRIGQYCAKLTPKISYEEGAVAEPISVAWYAVTQMKPRPDEICVVIGLGVIGLAVVQILKSMGVQTIIASGRREERLRLAKESGASVVVDAAKEDAVAAVAEAAKNGRGADVVFEVAGFPQTFQQAIQMVHRGGRIDLVGLYSEPITWSPNALVGNDVNLFGCGLKWDLPGAIELLKAGKVNAKSLVTHQFPLAQAAEAFNTQLKDPKAVKVLLIP